MHLGLKTDAAHADRLAHILPVNHKLLRLDQQQALIRGDVDGLGGFDHTRHVSLCDFAVLDRHHAAGIDAANMAAGDAGVDAGYLAVGHQFSLFERLLDALHSRVNVDHHAALEAVAVGNAETGQLQFSARQDFCHHGHDLAGSNVESHHQIFIFFGHFLYLFTCLLSLSSSAVVVMPRNRSA